MTAKNKYSRPASPGTNLTETGTLSGPVTFAASAMVVLVAVIVLIGVYVGKWSFAQVMRDASAEYGYPVYAGFVSELGFAGWIAAATATGLAAAVRPSRRHILLPASLLSLLLGLDDQFTLHDNLLPRIGIPETLVFLAYILICLLVLRPLLAYLIRLRLPLLALSLTGFAASLAIDRLAGFGPDMTIFLEDMAKFAGIAFWAAFWLRYSAAVLRAPATSRGGMA